MEPTKAKGKRPRPAYKALWQAAVSLNDRLREDLDEIERNCDTRKEMRDYSERESARTAHQLQAVTKDRRDWRVAAIVEALVIAALLLFAR